MVATVAVCLACRTCRRAHPSRGDGRALNTPGSVATGGARLEWLDADTAAALRDFEAKRAERGGR